jgi:hypothetical protein
MNANDIAVIMFLIFVLIGLVSVGLFENKNVFIMILKTNLTISCVFIILFCILYFIR